MTTTTTIPVAGDPFTAAPAHPSTAQVESSSRPGLFHDVTLEPEESCSCEATIPLCRHIRIARIRAARARAKARPCACNGGWITLGQLVVDPETGEERGVRALPLPQVRGAKLGRREYSLSRGILRGSRPST